MPHAEKETEKTEAFSVIGLIRDREESKQFDRVFKLNRLEVPDILCILAD